MEEEHSWVPESEDTVGTTPEVPDASTQVLFEAQGLDSLDQVEATTMSAHVTSRKRGGDTSKSGAQKQ